MSCSKILPKFEGVDKSRLSISKGKKNRMKEERFRQVDKQKISDILGDNTNQNTEKSERKDNKILVSYLKQVKKNENYAEYSVEEMDDMLSVFWFAVAPQKEGSEHYSVSSLHHIRYGIKRLLQNNGKTYDITVDPHFAKSQKMFKEACKELKRKGFGHVRHTDEVLPTGW